MIAPDEACALIREALTTYGDIIGRRRGGQYVGARRPGMPPPRPRR